MNKTPQLRLDHSFLFAIIIYPPPVNNYLLRLDHSFLFAIMNPGLDSGLDELRLDHSFLFAIIPYCTPTEVVCCGLTTLSYLL